MIIPIHETLTECFYRAHGYEPHAKQIVAMEKSIPTHIQVSSLQWGWNDFKVKGFVYRWIKDNIPEDYMFPFHNIKVKCPLFEDIRRLASGLIGDNYAFSYDPNTDEIIVGTNDLPYLIGNLRKYDLECSFTFIDDTDGVEYDDSWIPVKDENNG